MLIHLGAEEQLWDAFNCNFSFCHIVFYSISRRNRHFHKHSGVSSARCFTDLELCSPHSNILLWGNEAITTWSRRQYGVTTLISYVVRTHSDFLLACFFFNTHNKGFDADFRRYIIMVLSNSQLILVNWLQTGGLSAAWQCNPEVERRTRGLGTKAVLFESNVMSGRSNFTRHFFSHSTIRLWVLVMCPGSSHRT